MAAKIRRNNKLKFQRHGASHPLCYNRTACVQPLRGSVLICVMVVLLIVGLLISQTLQTLLLVRRGDDARQQLRQARELVELGEIVLRQNPSAQNINEVRCDADSRDESRVESRAESHFTASDSGSIGFERLNSGQDGPRQVRISVIYRTGSHAEITATHIVAESEELP